MRKSKHVFFSILCAALFSFSFVQPTSVKATSIDDLLDCPSYAQGYADATCTLLGGCSALDYNTILNRANERCEKRQQEQ